MATINIPITKLRYYYNFMRDFPEVKMRELMAKKIVASKDLLIGLFVDSVKHFERYKCAPSEKQFHKIRSQGARRSYLDKPSKFASCLQVRLGQAKKNKVWTVNEVNGTEELNFRMVDYEISPWRTPNAQFDDGTSGKKSGRPGLDLLLQSAADGTPIIGEIKAQTDTDMFLALIQSLVYASELATPNQRERLKDAYEEFVRVRSSKIDIYLIYEKSKALPKLLKESKAIAKILMAPESHAGRYVRRIAFINADIQKDKNGVEFTIDEVFP